MTLLDQQQCFARNVGLLLSWIYSQGYSVTFGEAERPQVTADAYFKAGKGISNSLHLVRLAIDLNLFKGGVYSSRTADHAPLGAYWKTLHPLNRWGGDFEHCPPDGNHYSMEFGGRQ